MTSEENQSYNPDATQGKLEPKAINLIYKTVGEMNHERQSASIQLIQRSFVNTDIELPSEENFWSSLHHYCPHLIFLPDETYALESFVVLMDLYHHYKYIINHTADGTDISLVNKCKQVLEKAIALIREKTLTQSEIDGIEEQHQSLIMTMITIIKRRAERIYVTHDFVPSLLLNEDYFFQHQRVVSLIPNRGLRFLIVEKILLMLEQQDIIFSGTYALPNVEGTRKFYFDSLLLKNDELLNKIRNSFLWQNQDPVLQEVVKKILRKPKEDQYHIYMQAIKTIQKQTLDINKVLIDEKIPISPASVSTIIGQFQQLKKKYNQIFSDYKKNEHNFIDKTDIKPFLNTTEDNLMWLRKQLFEEFIIFSQHLNHCIHQEDFLDISEDHHIIQVAYRIINLFPNYADKLKAIQKIWNLFLDAFTTHLARYNINFYKEKTSQQGNQKKPRLVFLIRSTSCLKIVLPKYIVCLMAGEPSRCDRLGTTSNYLADGRTILNILIFSSRRDELILPLPLFLRVFYDKDNYLDL